jgi:general secretion pathway protein K
MSAPCGVCSSSASRRSGQSGAAILLAMLTLMLVATLAAFVVSDYGAAVELVGGRHDQLQSRWLARGAVDWARNVLAEDARTSAIDYFGENWAMHVPPTAVEDGEVSGEIDEYSGRFDLNSLVVGGVADPAQVEIYGRLLDRLGVPRQTALGLIGALVDWEDADERTSPDGAESDWYLAQKIPYQSADAPLLDVDELALVRGYDADLIARLRPFVAALPDRAPLNVNTASAEVLSASVAGLSIDDARVLVARRQAEPFRDVADFVSKLPPSVTGPNSARLAVTSRYFLVVGRAKYGQAMTRMQVLLDRRTTWPEIVWQKIL